MEVGIRELRSNLASILEAVDKGTVVTITHHGTPRATIQPIAAPEETVFERGVREGWLTLGPNFYSPRANRRPTVVLSPEASKRVWEAFMEDREDDR